MPIQSVNPANGTLLRSFTPLPSEVVKAKISLAHEAYRRYGDTTLIDRALWMKKLAGILEHEVDELAALITTEMGKTITASRAEILSCAATCRYYAENAASILKEESIATEGNKSYVRWDPLGVILAVMPGTYPFGQTFRFLAPALMAGNGVLLKLSSNVPQCALSTEYLVRRAGFPRGLFQTLLIESHQVESVLVDPLIAAVTVTGSEAAGRAVAAQAGWLMKKSVLELGASDPFVVMPSADMVAAVRAAVDSRCTNNGQSVLAAKRFIIHEEVYDEFELLFTAAMEEQKVGDPMREETQIGPMATELALKDLETQVAAAVAAGGRLLAGGERMLSDGCFFEPTVIVDVPRTADIYKSEIFGPVALLFKAASLAHAIEIANDTPFGLGASVWTQIESEQESFITRLECGGVFVNQPVSSDPRLPFGGIKQSGYGRELSASGMREFMNAKTVVVREAAQHTQLAYDPGFDAALEETILAMDHEPRAQIAVPEQDTSLQPAAYDDNHFKRLLEEAMQTKREAVSKF
jgi:succinate-semialdehyde dehydrogenase/glutarate-semialdehyde dehydrogenase